MKTTTFFTALICLLLFSGCSARILDFTFVSSKNTSIEVPAEAKGARVTGKSIKFLGIGANVKEAVDKAIEKEGTQYDALVDGVIRVKSYFIARGYECEGTPVNTAKLKAYMGEEEFQNWAKAHDIRYKSEEKESSDS